ncbi:galaxin-2 isoform X2 [Pimephales promelas]|uniref:galaxin-2 isoform X2 n=1 Tax=Pimephales promelas TaxID=90988 RepID=UPI001955517D|nr:galaxin-2 isoform X2 [Pimephales promelas]
MEVYTSTACVTILCIIGTLSAQGIPDTGSHGNTGSSGPMESSTPLRCGNESHISSGHSCCNDTLTLGLSHLVADCCGSEAFNPLNEICCNGSVFVRTRADMTCYEGKDRSHSSALSSSTEPELKCGSETYNPKKEMCCSGKPYRASALNKCCGTKVYRLGDDNALCCNGTLYHGVSKKSECVADILYSPDNSTCHLPARARLGEHCCGGKTFNPVTHICCNGHSHLKTNGNFCCGSDVYDHHKKFMKCCSGHLYNVINNKGKAECCGNLLLENKTNQICCSSSNHAILYNTKPNHHCCGHYYFNTSLWSCCAQRLKSTPSPGSHAEERLKPLVDLIPDICNKTVFFGKVESVALDLNKRHIVLKVVNVIEDPWLNVSLDHCNSPVLENGMTYLWEKNGNVYKPLSISFDLISDIHMFYTVCKHKCQKVG